MENKKLKQIAFLKYIIGFFHLKNNQKYEKKPPPPKKPQKTTKKTPQFNSFERILFKDIKCLKLLRITIKK